MLLKLGELVKTQNRAEVASHPDAKPLSQTHNASVASACATPPTAGTGHRCRNTEQNQTCSPSPEFNSYGPAQLRFVDLDHIVEELADHCGGEFVGATGAVRVDLHRRRAIGVPESRGDGRHGHSGIQQLRRLEVSQVVQAN